MQNTNFYQLYFQGKVELELSLLTKEEAENAPVGLGREEPDPLPLPKYVSLLFNVSFSEVLMIS